MNSVLANKQNQYDKVEAEMGGIGDIIMKTPALTEYDRQRNREKATEYNKKLEDIATKHNQDLGAAAYDVKKLTKDILYDPELQTRKANYNSAMQHFEDIDKDKESGLSQQDKSTYKQNVLNQYKGTQLDETGKFNTIQLPGYNKQVDESKKINEALDRVNADITENPMQVFGLRAYEDAVRTGTVEQLKKQKLLDVANAVIENDPETSLSIKQREAFNPNLNYKQNIRKYADALAQGMAYTKEDNKLNTFANQDYLNPLQKIKLKALQEAKETTHTQSEALKQNVPEIKTFNEVSFKNGNVDIEDYKEVPYTTPDPENRYKTITAYKKVKLSPEEYSAKREAVKNEIHNLRTKYNMSGTDEQVVNDYKQANKGLAEQSIPLESLSNVAAKNITEGILRNKQQRNFYLLDNKGQTSTGTFDEVKDELGLNDEEFDKELEKQKIGGFTQAGPVPGAYYTEIKGRRVLISPDKEVSDLMSTSWLLNQASLNFDDSKDNIIDTPTGLSFKVDKQYDKNSKSWKFEYEPVIKQNDKYVPSKHGEKYTMSDIRKFEVDNIKKSNYLGTDISILKNYTTE